MTYTLTFAEAEVELFLSRFEQVMRERRTAFVRNGHAFSFTNERQFHVALCVAKACNRPISLMETNKPTINIDNAVREVYRLAGIS